MGCFDVACLYRCLRCEVSKAAVLGFTGATNGEYGKRVSTGGGGKREYPHNVRMSAHPGIHAHIRAILDPDRT